MGQVHVSSGGDKASGIGFEILLNRTSLLVNNGSDTVVAKSSEFTDGIRLVAGNVSVPFVAGSDYIEHCASTVASTGCFLSSSASLGVA